MAFSRGNESTEGSQFVRLYGMASVFVKGLNPTKAELEAFYGREFDKDPVYTKEVERNGVMVPQIELDFMVVADPEKHKTKDGNPIDFKSRVTIYLVKNYRTNRDGNKYLIIDKYGRTAWATKEEINNGQIPMYSNGPARISADYHVAYEGEEDLINFLRAYLNVTSCERYIDKKWVMLDDSKLPDCESSLEHIEDYFKGDVSEIREYLSYQPNNKVKVCFGIRRVTEGPNAGKQYQTAYTKTFLKNNATNYSKLDEEIQAAKARGSYADTDFSVEELHPYEVQSSDLSKPQSTEQPRVKSPWGNK